MRPQAERVMAYMEQHGEISPKQAVRDLGIYRLSAVVFDLVNKEYVDIYKIKDYTINPDGTISSFERYSLWQRDGWEHWDMRPWAEKNMRAENCACAEKYVI